MQVVNAFLACVCRRVVGGFVRGLSEGCLRDAVGSTNGCWRVAGGLLKGFNVCQGFLRVFKGCQRLSKIEGYREFFFQLLMAVKDFQRFLRVFKDYYYYLVY